MKYSYKNKTKAKFSTNIDSLWHPDTFRLDAFSGLAYHKTPIIDAAVKVRVRITTAMSVVIVTMTNSLSGVWLCVNYISDL